MRTPVYKLQLGTSIATVVVDCGRKGVRLITMEVINVDQYVGEYVDLSKFYMLRVNAEKVIDSAHFGGRTRFINHSCDPNCALEKWNVRGLERCGVFAI
ncbi:putative histone-lysine N-methyltransferase NSD2 [Phytophthora megakarya]|uniref:Putative histone-lysine N-methyltransferase NSD2 n=1 Tax=Phytophthora megakarya TaxID=4795 RepID=A0A225UV40_9STRA|nr:putative histone-lysine N-methyltransferase NSD2 [Phytophthora megakarya]